MPFIVPMQLPLIICSLLTIAYIVLMVLYRIGWSRQPDFILPKGFKPRTKISVIIPARDEANNIGVCLDSILAGDYPKELFEIIIIDDHSTDGTGDIVDTYNAANVRCLRLAEYMDATVTAYKKKAITTGIAHSTGELIVTTDADCIVPEGWLTNIAAMYEQQKPVMIIAPVAFTTDNSLVQLFQCMDFMGMQGITIAAYRLKMGNMSNGANLAFSRTAFDAVDGYAGVDHLSSGDDYLLMMKLNDAFPGKIACMKSKHAIVSTTPQPDWGSFLQQRIRWASKSAKYDDKKLTGILIFVYLYNCVFIALLIAGIFIPGLWLVALGMYVVKVVIELFFLFPVSAFFNRRRQLVYFPLLELLHIPYIVLAGFLGFAGVYHWKGRKTR